MSQLLHKAEEHGQSRELKAGEVLAFTLLAAIKALALGVATGALVIGGRKVMGEDVTVTGVLLTVGGVFMVALAANILGDLELLTEGLRQWRSVETFSPSPPAAAPEPQQAHPPILIRAGDRRGYLDRDEPPALPAPRRQQPLQLTPKSVSVILREVIEGHDGQWSRKRLMAIKVDGKKVSRRLYEELTDVLAGAGVLAERAAGGFTLPADVRKFDDLQIYFPGLPGVAGRVAGRQEQGGLKNALAAGGQGATLAERHAARYEAKRLRTERLAREEIENA